ncbi:hypothetical protein BJ165DRAFT_1410544 [Panaeolus papilionaceus]|nr:hypothetical protein BJ165DRAFT_1410544 [Panaeolus papilionaceus]
MQFNSVPPPTSRFLAYSWNITCPSKFLRSLELARIPITQVMITLMEDRYMGQAILSIRIQALAQFQMMITFIMLQAEAGLEVSNRLFAVPKEHLDVPGSSFHVMFRDGSLNKDAIRGLIPRGSHSIHPIVLTGIGVEAFRSFLAVAWPRSNTHTQLDVQGWKHVLTLATGWKYDKVHSMSVDTSSAMSGSAMECAIAEGTPYVVSPLGSIALRSTPLLLQDATDCYGMLQSAT